MFFFIDMFEIFQLLFGTSVRTCCCFVWCSFHMCLVLGFEVVFVASFVFYDDSFLDQLLFAF